MMGMLNNGLILMGLSVSDQMIVRGLIILAAVALTLREKTPLRRQRCFSTSCAAAIPASSRQAIALHQAGKAAGQHLRASTSTRWRRTPGRSRAEADRLGLKVFAMTKQIGRNRCLLPGGACAAASERGGGRHGMRARDAVAPACAVGHIGHLVQVPRAEAERRPRSRPTTGRCSTTKGARSRAPRPRGAAAARTCWRASRPKATRFYRGHEGGFDAADVVAVADALDALRRRARFAGITTFPALLFDPEKRKVAPTPQPAARCERPPRRLPGPGATRIEINAPGTTSSVAARGARRGRRDPGRAGPRADRHDAAARARGSAGAAGRASTSARCRISSAARPIASAAASTSTRSFRDYEVKAIVGREPTTAASALARVEIPPPAAIDYYGMIDAAGGAAAAVGDTRRLRLPRRRLRDARLRRRRRRHRQRRAGGRDDPRRASARPVAWPM